MTSVAIMQPTFLPWIGYFSLINKVNKFIFLDSVQFDKRSWQQRNKISNNDNFIFLTVPVLTKNKLMQPINKVKIHNKVNFKKQHLKTIELNYKKTKFFELYFPEIEKIYNVDYENLVDLNINFIKYICNCLFIKTDFSKSSDLNFLEKKNSLLIKICKHYNANQYISPLGSKNYLNENMFKDNKILVKYHDFLQKKYPRDKKKFISNLSSLDALFYLGKKARDLL